MLENENNELNLAFLQGTLGGESRVLELKKLSSLIMDLTLERYNNLPCELSSQGKQKQRKKQVHCTEKYPFLRAAFEYEITNFLVTKIEFFAAGIKHNGCESLDNQTLMEVAKDSSEEISNFLNSLKKYNISEANQIPVIREILQSDDFRVSKCLFMRENHHAIVWNGMFESIHYYYSKDLFDIPKQILFVKLALLLEGCEGPSVSFDIWDQIVDLEFILDNNLDKSSVPERQKALDRFSKLKKKEWRFNSCVLVMSVWYRVIMSLLPDEFQNSTISQNLFSYLSQYQFPKHRTIAELNNETYALEARSLRSWYNSRLKTIDCNSNPQLSKLVSKFEFYLNDIGCGEIS